MSRGHSKQCGEFHMATCQVSATIGQVPQTESCHFSLPQHQLVPCAPRLLLQSCPAGTWSAAGASQCTECAAGTYTPDPGAASCTPCDAGTYSTATGADSASTCTECTAGTYSSEPGSTTCQGCAEGFYASGSANQACTACGAGTSSSAVNATSADTCTVGCAAACLCTACQMHVSTL